MRQIDASNGKLTADVTGEVETEEGVLAIRRIHVGMRLVASKRPERLWSAHTVFTRCAARSIVHCTKPFN